MANENLGLFYFILIKCKKNSLVEWTQNVKAWKLNSY